MPLNKVRWLPLYSARYYQLFPIFSFVLFSLLCWDSASVKFRTVHWAVYRHSKRQVENTWIQSMMNKRKINTEQSQKVLILFNMLAETLSWLQFSKLQERVETAESRVSVLETMIDDLQWDIDKIRKREQRLNRHLADVLERVSTNFFARKPEKLL